jgi:hypothetical protein
MAFKEELVSGRRVLVSYVHVVVDLAGHWGFEVARNWR